MIRPWLPPPSPPMPWKRVRLRLLAAAVVGLAATIAPGQNDWQYPDPYFGILEIETSRAPAGNRRPRAEIPPRHDRHPGAPERVTSGSRPRGRRGPPRAAARR